MKLSPETVDTVLRIRHLDRNCWPKLRHHPRRTVLDAQFGQSCAWSLKTSASNFQTFAPCCQLSAGRPALRHV